MRELKDHVVEGGATDLKIVVRDNPGHGGANHAYEIRHEHPAHPLVVTLNFQNGPIGEHGINGITQEALLAIIIDRLRSFQSGPFACQENGIALNCAELALGALKERTTKRIARGVEGKNVK